MTSATTERRDKSVISYSYDGELKKALEIAEAYGFKVIPPLKIESEERAFAEEYNCPEHHIASLRHADERLQQFPEDVVRIAHTRKVPYKNKLELRLEIIGDKESSAEGLLFQTARAILEEYGHHEPTVTINSVGGKESVGPFSQAVTQHFRGHLANLHPDCRTSFKKSVFAPFRCSHKECMEARAEAPHSLNFLTEQSKQHFTEVLEYLESFDLPYTVNPHMVGNEHYTTRTLFVFDVPTKKRSDDEEESTHIAWGERYDSLSKKIGMKKITPAVNLTLDLQTKSTKEAFKERQRHPVISIHVVHAGRPAKMRVLKLAEILRGSQIRASMQLHKNSITEQLERAKVTGAPLLLIVGQKEVLDGTVMVRQTATSCQESIPVTRLVGYLKAHL